VVRVTRVEHRSGYELRLTFNDGRDVDVDLTDELWGEMFEPLRDVSLFSRVEVDPELGTVGWPNGADLDPESLYEAVRPVRRASDTAALSGATEPGVTSSGEDVES
jgi:hypothetical protein